MSSACDSCAFRKSPGANEEPYNTLRAEICSLGGVPFYCHHGFDWRDPVQAAIASHSPSMLKACAGWQARIRELKRSGQFDEFRPIRRAIAERALRLIEVFISSSTSPGDRKSAKRILQRCLRALKASSARFGRMKLDMF